MSYTKLLYHIVFRPKNSAPAITIAHEEMLYRFIWSFISDKGGVLHRIGGMPNHVHILLFIPPTISIADFVRDMKISSSKFLKSHSDEFPLFEGWARSYCALSYSDADMKQVVEYIRNQKAHHRVTSMYDEMSQLLRQHGIEPDMKHFLDD